MFSEFVVLEQKNFQVKPHNMIKLIPNHAYARIKVSKTLISPDLQRFISSEERCFYYLLVPF